MFSYNNIALLELPLLPKREINVKFVPLIASLPISKQISCKMRLAITQTPL